ncbi:MAG TPA: transglycosylase SLT domain-containing protein [Burkholderiales bacterium]|nr:transglycosylase SLT domain-containing protein [Burkholderiales bacterium]
MSQPVPSARPRNAPPLAQPGVDGRVLTPGHLRLGELPLNPAIDLTVPAVGLWARIRNGFALPDIDSPLVHEQEAWYANRPEYVKRMVARSQRYLYHVVAEIEKRGLPSEIALLPMIESAYNPTAYSRSHASGIWQFIPSTGKLYGLEQNFWQDERRDVLAATRAALDYLEKLYDQFGSWDLALAAYNWGEGAVARAIARNEARGLPTDYQSLTMPRETRYYVPKLQAVKNIVADPAKFGLELPEIPNQPYFTHVTVPQNIDVKLAARLAEMPLEEFLSLNPSHNRPVIRADGGATLLLPMDKARVFATNLENHDKPLVSWQAYTVKRGETLEHVAGKFGTNAAYLRQVNALGSSRKLKVAGHTLLVPMRNLERGGNLDEVGAIRLEARAPAEHGAAAPARRQHVVARGDTLYNIARRYGVSVEQVKSWNGLTANHVAIGQRLAVGGTPAVNGHTHPSQTVRAASAPQPRKKNVTRIAKARTGAAKPQHTVQVQPGKNGQLKVVYAEKKPANRDR